MKTGIAGITQPDVRFGLDQIVRQADEHAYLESLSDQELSFLISDLAARAATARTHQRTRLARQHASN